MTETTTVAAAAAAVTKATTTVAAAAVTKTTAVAAATIPSSPDGVDDWEAVLPLGEILREALVGRVVLKAQVGVVVPHLEMRDRDKRESEKPFSESQPYLEVEPHEV